MKKLIRRGRPSPSMIVGVIALVMAMAGGAYAASVGLNDLGKKAKVQTVGVGKLRYVTTQLAVPVTPANQPGTEVSALCQRPNSDVIGGGIKVGNDATTFVNDSHPRGTDGWTGTVQNIGPGTDVATVTAICARATRVTGTAPAFKD